MVLMFVVAVSLFGNSKCLSAAGFQCPCCRSKRVWHCYFSLFISAFRDGSELRSKGKGDSKCFVLDPYT